LPAALRTAPIPSVLARLDQLRPGLSRLAQLAGGPEGRLLQTASAGSRAGFLLAHVQAWMAKGDPALAPLADRPAWILHYGVQRPRETRPNQIPAPEGTLIFLPGALPGRTNLALGLLRLNPFSSGARVRKSQLKDGVVIDVLHGAGGVLYLQETQDGTWLADRLSALEAREQGFDTTLALADGWGRVAMAGVGRASASLWMIPRQAPLDAYASGSASAPAAAVPASLLKASPRGSGAVIALGSGPTTRALQAFFSVDLPFEVPVPQQPTLAGGAVTLSPEQQKSFQDAQEEAKRRSSLKAAMRRTLDRLLRTLDGQGAAMHWNGWTAAPPISEADKAALQAFRKQGYWISVRKERINRAPGFGGFGEPGFTPSLAFALPLRPGSGTEADTAMKALFLQAFRGTLETRMVGPATLRRVRTVQAFAPSFAVAGDLLVLATDDAAAATVLAGLQGQAPTLADLPPSGWGQVELDGSRIATDLEQLLLAYLGAQSGKPRRWWEPESAAQTGDEVSEEVAATFGPFLNLVKQQGRVRMSVTPGGSGFELRPL
ncbi:MAG TPA: hypothetical protein VJ600_00330, partial [Holophagaceae bacterium]|nr:hypothetical protein [Holophagaceae bacterium]